jgi:uncharacterized coiled-coil DUF342 family protein
MNPNETGEKSPEDLFNESVQFKKEANEARDHLDAVEREIVLVRNQIDELRTKIRNKENEIRDWLKIIRTKECLAKERDRQGWAVKRMG